MAESALPPNRHTNEELRLAVYPGVHKLSQFAPSGRPRSVASTLIMGPQVPGTQVRKTNLAGEILDGISDLLLLLYVLIVA